MPWGDRTGGDSSQPTPATTTSGGWGSRVAATKPASGDGSFLHNLVGDPIKAAVGLGPGLVHLAAAGVKDQNDILHGRVPHHVYETAVKPLAQDPFVKDIGAGIRHPLRTDPLYARLTGGKLKQSQTITDLKAGHVLVPVLDALSLASFGSARVLAVGALPENATAAEVRAAIVRGRTSGPLDTITVRDTATGATIPTRTLPRNAYQAGRMRATDAALKKLPRSTPLLGESARAARAVTRESQPVLLRHLADARLSTYQRAFSRLKTEQRVALGALARVPLPEDLAGWKRILADDSGEPAQRLLATLSDPKVLKLYGDFTDKRLVAAHEAAVALVDAREEILTRTGDLTPEMAGAAVYAPSRIARGAEYVNPTPGRLGISPALDRAQRRSDRLQNRFDRLYEAERAGTTTKRLTEAEARARLAVLELGHDTDVTKLAAARYGPIGQREVNARTYNNKRAARQQSGKGGASSYKSKLKPTIKEERIRLVEQELLDAIAKNPDHPTMKRWSDRMAEIDRLRAVLNPEMFEKVDRNALGTKEVYKPRSYRLERLGGALADANQELAQAKAAAERRVEPVGLVGGGTPEGIAAEIGAAGRPEPFYLPDTPAASPKTRGSSRESAALSPPVSDVHGSQGILFRTGQLALHPDLLTPAFLRAARLDYRLEKHAQAKAIATPIAEGAGLPAGMRWVREIRGEKIPYTETTRGEHLAEVDKHLPGEKTLTVPAHETDAVVALDTEGRRLAVTERLARDLETEYRQNGRVFQLFVQRPLDVWRALVLNLRIPWLVNNIVGNNLLYALRFAGVDGLKAYVGLLSEPTRRRLLRLPATQRHLTREDMAAIFPEQTRGTFIGTQSPNAALGKARGAVRAVGAGLAPLDRVTEQALRRAAVETVLRGSAEVKKVYRDLPKEERTLRAAMTKAASNNPELRRLANTEANRALGDYLSLNATERGTLRRVAPFYGWYREILRIAAHAVVDTPIRTTFLARLAIAEEERQQDQRGPFPTFLEGSVALGKGPQGTERILPLRQINPLSTVADLGRAASFVVNPSSRTGANALIGLTNPFIAGPATTLVKSVGGDPIDVSYQGAIAAQLSKYGWPGVTAAQVFGALPQAQAITPPGPSKLYPTRDRNTIILRLLGYPVQNVNQGQASLYASQGR